MVMSQINIDLLVLFLILTTIDAQNECSGGSANCINIRNCPQVMSILTDPTPPSAQMLQTIKNLLCGFESNDPKYCCNQVTTTTTTTVKSEIETDPDPPDVTNHPNLRLLDHQACGPIPQHRVISNNKTEIFQYPWMAISTYDTGKTNSGFLCSGTVISSRYVLIAANCGIFLLHIKQFRKIGVRIGDHDISKEPDCIKNNEGVEVVCAERYQEFGIDNIQLHPKYKQNPLRNDIALIRLNGTVDFRSRNVKPICLPFGTAAILTRKRAVVTGWNVTESSGLNSQELLQAKLPLVTNKQCKEIYKADTQIWYKHLCAGGQRGKVFCSGNSGGPLHAVGIYNGRSVRIIQHGIVSFGVSCTNDGFPGVYTRVSYYMDWILSTMTD